MLSFSLLKSISLSAKVAKKVRKEIHNPEKHSRRAFIKSCGGIRQFKKIRRLHRIQNSSKEMIQNV